MDSRLNSAFWTLRIAFGLTAFLAGLDKYFNLLANWEKYVSPLSPLAPTTLMHVAGAIEIVAGVDRCRAGELLQRSRRARPAADAVGASELAAEP